jgi:CubicO group peptidase (beta-lactamase class C family)
MRQSLRELIEHSIGEGAVAGAAVAVVRGDESLFEHFAGEAAPGLPSSPDVLWPIASISKLFTAAMAMRLVELGELRLETRIGALEPRFTSGGRDEVDVRQLLVHTSGLPYESPEMDARLAMQTPLAGLIEEAIGAPLGFQPGTRFSYSDYGYLLAGHAASIATGTRFPELVDTLVVQPMSLHATFSDPPAEVQDRIAYVRGVLAEGTGGAMYNTPYARALSHPAFGVVSSLHDMVRFARHFVPGGPRIHRESTVEAMTTSQSGDVPGEHPSLPEHGAFPRVPWGFGFELQTAELPPVFSKHASPGTFGHGGASGCHLVVDPVRDMIVVVLTNTHLLTGIDAWFDRHRTLLDTAFAELAEGG